MGDSSCELISSIGPYATGWLEDSGWQNYEKNLHKTVNSGSRATFFRHSAVLSPPAILFCLSIVRACNEMDELCCEILHHSYAGNFLVGVNNVSFLYWPYCVCRTKVKITSM